MKHRADGSHGDSWVDGITGTQGLTEQEYRRQYYRGPDDNSNGGNNPPPGRFRRNLGDEDYSNTDLDSGYTGSGAGGGPCWG